MGSNLRTTELELRFNRLTKKWKQDAEIYSFTHLLYTHPDYLRIIKMGKKVLPYILRDLETTRSNWFFALTKITGVNPVKEEDKGNWDKKIKSWLDWAKSKNIQTS